MKQLILSIALVVAASMPVQAAGGSTISLESLQEMFSSIRAKTNWNVDGDLLWGYFFTDHDPAKFSPLKKHLEGMGYRYVTILKPEGGGVTGIYYLHVERVEHHTPWSLHQRNQ